MANDLFLYAGEANPNDIRLRDPAAIAISGDGTAAQSSASADGVGVESFIVGSGLAAQSSALADGAGAEQFIGTGSATAQPATASSAGSEDELGAGRAIAQPASADGTGTVTGLVVPPASSGGGGGSMHYGFWMGNDFAVPKKPKKKPKKKKLAPMVVEFDAAPAPRSLPRSAPVAAVVAEMPKPVLIELKPDPAIKRRRMEEELVELGLI